MEYTYSVFRPNPRATTHGADSKSANSSACSSRWRTNQRIEELEKEKEQLDYERALALKRLSPRALNALASHTAVVLCRHQRRHLIQTPSGVTMREAKQLGMALAGGIGYDGCASHNDVRSGLGSVTSYSNSELGDILCASEHDVAASALARSRAFRDAGSGDHTPHDALSQFGPDIESPHQTSTAATCPAACES